MNKLQLSFLLLTCFAGGQAIASNEFTVTRSLENMNAKQILDVALIAEGQAYLEAEAGLRRASDNVVELRIRLQSNDPFERAMSKVILDWIEGRSEDNDKALAYFPEIAERKRMTPALLPRPAIVARDLSLRFQGRVAEFLAVRLVKEIDWPAWRVSGVLLYLTEQKQLATEAALLRFAADPRREAWRPMAISALKALGDPDLSTNVRFERLRIEAIKKTFPAALFDLETK